MGLFDFMYMPDINEGVNEYKRTQNAVLLDVRTREEYAEGHIDGSLNIPLQNIDSVPSVISDKGTPLFVHCRSGARSGQAVSYLKQIGYTNVKNIGGIINYKGKAAI